MPQFRWSEVQNDIILAREVAAKRPSKLIDWESIAKTLSAAFTTSSRPVHLKGRGCKERMDRLLAKFSSDDTQSLKRYYDRNNILAYYNNLLLLLNIRSGTEEEYMELTQLLQDISDYQRDVQSAIQRKCEAKKQKEIADKTAGEEMRQSAMETMASKYHAIIICRCKCILL